MKWETVKKHFARELYTQVMTSEKARTLILADLGASDFEAKKGRSRAEMIKVYADKAYDLVMGWDIRMVGRLRELFPWACPPSLKKGDLVLGYDDRGDWEILTRHGPHP